jgi:hypothetical protein
MSDKTTPEPSRPGKEQLREHAHELAAPYADRPGYEPGWAPGV